MKRGKSLVKIPEKAQHLMRLLKYRGYEAFVVGGCVRDSLLGREPGDWDICTNANPKQMKQCFEGLRVIETGMRHGTLTVMADGRPFEVTAYRIDGAYTDGRHPDQVRYTSNIRADLSRRDFTVNAMAYNDDAGLVDPFGGAGDLKAEVLRCVGRAETRFNEDGLRIMRCIRFASQLEFGIEAETSNALYSCKSLLDIISAERIRTELDKLLCGSGAAGVLTRYREIAAQVIWEIRPMFDLDQRNPYHSYSVWDHTLRAVGHIKNTPELRLSALFHDIGKPGKMTIDETGRGHFYKHEQLSEEIADRVMRRLKYDNRTRDTVTAVVRNHSIVFRPTLKYARRLLNRLGEERLRLLIEMEYADVRSQNPVYTDERVAGIRAFSQKVDEVLAQEQCFSMGDLAISGVDLLRLGVGQGPEIGAILNRLLDMVIDGELPNEKAALIKAAFHK